MITSVFTDEQFSSMSQVNAKVELYEGSTLVATCTCSKYLEDYKVDREGESGKFFGFGICHKLTLSLIDIDDEITDLVNNNTRIKVCLGDLASDKWDCPYPMFYTDEVTIDKKNHTIKIVAYDKLHQFAKYTLADLHLTAPYTIGDIYSAIVSFFGLSSGRHIHPNWELSYEKGANYEPSGTENLRDVMNHISEATCCIYCLYCAGHNTNTPNSDGIITHGMSKYPRTADLIISRDDYYELTTQAPVTLTSICHATELGENLATPPTSPGGVTQYIRNNPLLELRPDLADILNDLAAYACGQTFITYDLDWSGDYRLQPTDVLEVEVDDNTSIQVRLLSDTTTYGGTLNQTSSWEYMIKDDTQANPTTLREALDKTYAKVDKMEKEIILYVGEVVDTVVEDKIDTAINESIDGFDAQLSSLNNAVNTMDGKINTVGSDISALQTVQTKHEERFSKLELTTESITAQVNGLTETVEVVDTKVDTSKQEAIAEAEAEANKLIAEKYEVIQKDITTAQENAIAEANSNSQQLVDLLSGQLESDIDTAEKEAKDYTDEKVTILSQTINQKEAGIKVTTDAITQRVAATEETLLTKVDADDVYNKTEVYTKSETDSQINIAKNAINLSVSDTYETKATVSQKIEEVKQEAAKDATNKANAAETDANEYTDSKITTVVTTVNEKVAEINVTTDGIIQRVSAEETKTVEIESDIEELNSSITETNAAVAQLEIKNNSINASVQSLEQATTNNIETVNEEISSLTKKVEAVITPEQVTLEISKALTDGVDKVTTSTGFTFNEEGLHIQKEGSQMESTLDETGLIVNRYDTPVLTATNEGVNALNINVRQYLKVGGSRFETYKSNRTGCFWIGD